MIVLRGRWVDAVVLSLGKVGSSKVYDSFSMLGLSGQSGGGYSHRAYLGYRGDVVGSGCLKIVDVGADVQKG